MTQTPPPVRVPRRAANTATALLAVFAVGIVGATIRLGRSIR